MSLNNRTVISNRKRISTRDTNDVFLFNLETQYLQPGQNNQIANSTYSCASSNRTVQINAESVVEGILADKIPVGKLLNNAKNALVLDGPITNLIQNQIGNPATWISNATITNAIGPNNNSTYAIEDDSTSLFETSNTNYNFTYTSATYQTSVMIKQLSGNQNYCVWRPDSSGVSVDLVCNLTTAKWVRFYRSFVITPKTVTAVLFPSGVGSNDVSKIIAYNPIIALGAIPSEYYNGTRLGSNFKIQNANSVSNGRINLELELNPRTASANYGIVYILYQNAQNYVSYNGSTSKFTFAIGGNTFTSDTTFSWSDNTYTNSVLTAQKTIKLFLSFGNGNNQIYAKLDNNANVVITSENLGNLTTDDTYICSQSDVSVNTFASHISLIRTYKNNYTPEWI